MKFILRYKLNGEWYETAPMDMNQVRVKRAELGRRAWYKVDCGEMRM
jgi:hypothetical protein